MKKQVVRTPGVCVYKDGLTPVLFIMTSNCSEEFYSQIGYDKMLENYKNSLNGMVGPTKVMVCASTVNIMFLRIMTVNYVGVYDWF